MASAVTVILPNDGGTANAVAQTRLEYAKENNNPSQKYARLYTVAEIGQSKSNDLARFCLFPRWAMLLRRKHDDSRPDDNPRRFQFRKVAKGSFYLRDSHSDVRYHGSIDSALCKILERIFSTIAINYS